MSRTIRLAFAGCLFGLLIGTLVGLSNSPIVGTVIGAIIPIVAVLVSAFSTPRAEKAAATFDDILVFVMWFAGLCLIGALAGMTYRSQSAPSIAAVYGELTKIGVPVAEARSAVLDWLKTSPSAAESIFRAEGLFTSTEGSQDSSRCDGLTRPGSVPVDTESLETMRRSGVDRQVGLANAISLIPAELAPIDKARLSGAMFDLACD